MKVIFKKPIVEQISLAKAEAEDSGGEVDYIELSTREMRELRNHIRREAEPHTDGSFLVCGVKCVKA